MSIFLGYLVGHLDNYINFCIFTLQFDSAMNRGNGSDTRLRTGVLGPYVSQSEAADCRCEVSTGEAYSLSRSVSLFPEQWNVP